MNLKLFVTQKLKWFLLIFFMFCFSNHVATCLGQKKIIFVMAVKFCWNTKVHRWHVMKWRSVTLGGLWWSGKECLLLQAGCDVSFTSSTVLGTVDLMLGLLQEACVLRICFHFEFAFNSVECFLDKSWLSVIFVDQIEILGYRRQSFSWLLHVCCGRLEFLCFLIWWEWDCKWRV